MEKVKNNISEGNTQGDSDFKSVFGDFNETQEKLLLFGSSWKMLVMFILHVLSVAYQVFIIIRLFGLDTSTITVNAASFTILKIALLILLAISLVIPAAVYVIYSGSRKFNSDKVSLGLDIVIKYSKVILGLVILFAVFTGVMIVIGLFSNFFGSFGLGILAGVLYYISIISLLAALAFLRRAAMVLSDKKAEHGLSNPSSLKLLFFVLLVFVIIEFIRVGFYGVEHPGVTSAPSTENLKSFIEVLAQIRIVELVYDLLSMIVLGYTIYLIGDFAREFNYVKE